MILVFFLYLVAFMFFWSGVRKVLNRAFLTAAILIAIAVGLANFAHWLPT